jgi:hypothetical protein
MVPKNMSAAEESPGKLAQRARANKARRAFGRPSPLCFTSPDAFAQKRRRIARYLVVRGG